MGRLGAAVVLSALVAASFAGDARADEKSVCSAKYQSAQRLRASGKLTLARADLLRCAEPACPSFVSNDCKTWLAEVESDLPTLVFAVFDANGGDVPNALVRIDGATVPSATDGLGHALDPGEHVVEALAGGQSLREQLVVRVGEKSRRVELRFASALPPAPIPPVAPATPPPERASAATTESGSRPPVAAFVLGGLGVAAAAVGSVLWVTGSNGAKTYNAQCESVGCSSADHDNVQRQLIAGDVAWVAGLALGAAAVVVLVLHHDDRATTTVSVGPMGVGVSGRF